MFRRLKHNDNIDLRINIRVGHIRSFILVRHPVHLQIKVSLMFQHLADIPITWTLSILSLRSMWPFPVTSSCSSFGRTMKPGPATAIELWQSLHIEGSEKSDQGLVMTRADLVLVRDTLLREDVEERRSTSCSPGSSTCHLLAPPGAALCSSCSSTCQLLQATSCSPGSSSQGWVRPSISDQLSWEADSTSPVLQQLQSTVNRLIQPGHKRYSVGFPACGVQGVVYTVYTE